MQSFNRKFYYFLKPVVPWRVRMRLRRFLARRKLKTCDNIWPINESAGRTPEGWPGWPEGKKFSVVLTHDVESSEGLAKCRQLAELEMELGFRSSFNFIPEGAYRLPPELCDWLLANGFEVGVHDLHHNGKLFHSHHRFQRKAARINQHLKNWGAVGFRAGFMLRNLDWMHELDIAYDASTFDTDPFEPQPDGANTIFPFWIPAPAESSFAQNGTGGQNKGYVELPYTLPQDSTLYLVLRKTSPEIWLNKLDWIARHGGMALVNVHPDYLQFEGAAPYNHTFPASHYRALLEHIRERHAGRYWQPLAKEVAAFISNMSSKPVIRRAKRVCMITHSFYESDNRVIRYAESLAARGDHVDVLALRRSPQIPTAEKIGGVNVVRLQERYGKKERSSLDYLRPWLRFLWLSARWARRNHRLHGYDLVHVHNMPDFLVFAAWYPKLAGAKVILDIHDIVPELYGSKFSKNKGSATIAILKWLERRSARFANHIIVANDLWIGKFSERTGTEDRCSVFINNVDSTLFYPVSRTRADGKLIVLFPGGLQWHQGLDIALRAFVRVNRALPNAEFHIYGDGNMKPSLVTLAKELGFNGCVRFFDTVRTKDVAAIMAGADLGVVPKRADSFGNEAYSTKIMEFMSLRVPVVVSRTKVDQYYFNESIVKFFESGNHDALAEAMIEVLTDAELRQRLIDNAAAFAQLNAWDTRKQDYLRLVDTLCDPALAQPVAQK